MCDLFCFSCIPRIDAGAELLSDSVTLLAGSFQAHVGINTNGNPLLLAPNAVFPTPIFTPSGADLQIKATTIEQLESFVPALCRANLYVSQRHVGASHFPGLSYAPKCAPNMGAAVAGWHRTMPDTLHKKLYYFYRLVGLIWNRRDQ